MPPIAGKTEWGQWMGSMFTVQHDRFSPVPANLTPHRPQIVAPHRLSIPLRHYMLGVGLLVLMLSILIIAFQGLALTADAIST